MNKKKRILITAGGTVVKIDDVRHIGNFSTGSFASKIAGAALKKGHEVIYLHSKNAKVPDPGRGLKLVAYETYDDYSSKLKAVLNKNRIDIVFLAAAVSDYGVRRYEGKISSSEPEFTIRLFRLPKIITFVKKWSKKPIFQVGFKLLSGVSEKELVETAYISGLKNHSDLTIANDLKKIRSGKGEAVLVTPERGVIKLKEPHLADSIVEFATRRASAAHFKTVCQNNKRITQKYRNEIKIFRELCGKLSKKGLMTDFFKGSKSGHGSLALRTEGNSFLITARKSSKKDMGSDDVVFVKKINWKKRELMAESSSGKKPSFNAVLVAAILEKFKGVNAVVHTHSFVKGAPTTPFAYAPGTLEYALKPSMLFKKGVRVINLKNHGLIAVGADLKETVNYVLG